MKMARKNGSSEVGKLIAKASSLDGLIDYQEGAVVSRTLIDKEIGTVTLFAFEADQGLSEHTAPYDAMVYVFGGEAEVVISGKPVHLKSGELTVMPAGKPHSVKAVSRFKMMLIMIRA
jgi:quercetin dioxygenase-like cupin family protein